jgi:transcription antitermination factor NusG
LSKSRNKERALFPGYIFSCFDAAALLPIIVVPGVVNVVGRGPVPEPLDPAEILALRKLAESGLASEPWPWLRAGQRVRVFEGPLEGVEGILVRESGQDRLVISVSLLLRSVIAEVDRRSVEPVNEAA